MENNKQASDDLLKTANESMKMVEESAVKLNKMKTALFNSNQKILNDYKGEDKDKLENTFKEINELLENAHKIPIESLPNIIENLKKNVESNFNK